MESYFFIPGNRLHKFDAVEKLHVNEIIIDIEDAVRISERKLIIDNLVGNEVFKQLYVRIPLYGQDSLPDTAILNELISNGFNRFIFPKIQKASDFFSIMESIDNKRLEIILLIESPRFFLEVKDVLLKHGERIKGIGLGSHDFMSEVGGLHNLKNLEYARLHLLYLARMINIKAIDIASMELVSEAELHNEIRDGFEKGYDAKFFIHPWQIQVKNNLILYSEADRQWALKVKEALNAAGSAGEFNPIIMDGQIIERPHLHKMEKILNYYNNEGK